MNPEISTAMAAIALIDKLGGWSVGGICVFLGATPAIFVYLAARLIVKAINSLRRQVAINEKESALRFQTFQSEYENNIKFVNDYSTFVTDYKSLVNRLEDTLRRNNIVLTKMVDRIDTRREMK